MIGHGIYKLIYDSWFIAGHISPISVFQYGSPRTWPITMICLLPSCNRYREMGNCRGFPHFCSCPSYVLFKEFSWYVWFQIFFLCGCDMMWSCSESVPRPCATIETIHYCCSGGRLPSPENSQLQTLGDFKTWGPKSINWNFYKYAM